MTCPQPAVGMRDSWGQSLSLSSQEAPLGSTGPSCSGRCPALGKNDSSIFFPWFFFNFWPLLLPDRTRSRQDGGPWYPRTSR